MTALPYAAIDDPTADLLALIADEHTVPGHDAVDAFLSACEADAAAHGGFVSVNRVRAHLAAADIPPRRLSSLWGHYTGPGKPMRKTGQYEPDDGTTTRNSSHLHPVRWWKGLSP